MYKKQKYMLKKLVLATVSFAIITSIAKNDIPGATMKEQNTTCVVSENKIMDEAADETLVDEKEELAEEIKNELLLEATDAVPVGPSTWKKKTGTEGYVYRLYNVALLRDADPDGAKDWKEKLDHRSATASDVAWGFFFSKEFQEKNYSDIQYVKLLYRTIFGREADQGGMRDWLKRMENGMSREAVFQGFAGSEEFSKMCQNYGIEKGIVQLTRYRDRNEGVTGFIARLYTRMLGRRYEDQGLEYWCEMYLTGQKSMNEIAMVGFLHSQEFISKNLSNEEYVKRMYETFLNREPEPEGFRFWINNLNTGAKTKDDLVAGFVDSAEFQELKRKYGLVDLQLSTGCQHSWTEETKTVWVDEKGHYEQKRIPYEDEVITQVSYAQCSICKGKFYSNEDFMEHCSKAWDEINAGGSNDCAMASSMVYTDIIKTPVTKYEVVSQWVVDEDGYNKIVKTGIVYCSRCGVQR